MKRIYPIDNLILTLNQHQYEFLLNLQKLSKQQEWLDEVRESGTTNRELYRYIIKHHISMARKSLKENSELQHYGENYLALSLIPRENKTYIQYGDFLAQISVFDAKKQNHDDVKEIKVETSEDGRKIIYIEIEE